MHLSRTIEGHFFFPNMYQETGVTKPDNMEIEETMAKTDLGVRMDPLFATEVLSYFYITQ